MQFVTGLPDSLKIEEKWVVLVKGPWYGTPGSLGLPFNLNQSLSFPSLSPLDGVCSFLRRRPYFDMPPIFGLFIGKHGRGRLVSWVEKARLDRIRWLVEINEWELNHELLLSTKNLYELDSSHFPYIVPVLPCLLPEEVIKGEHFVLANLLSQSRVALHKRVPLKSLKPISLKKPW